LDGSEDSFFILKQSLKAFSFSIFFIKETFGDKHIYKERRVAGYWFEA
jgi:hypothetical protein